MSQLQTMPKTPASLPGWSIVDDVFWERYANEKLQGMKWKTLSYLRAMYNQIPGMSPSASHENGKTSCKDNYKCSDIDMLEPWFLHGDAMRRISVHRTAKGALRPHLLFQYKPYQHQEPLNISEDDVSAVLEAIFGEIDGDENARCGKEHGENPLSGVSDIASVILVKLVMDMYLKNGPVVAFPLVVHMLQSPMLQGSSAARVAVFDFIANLSVHAELLYEIPTSEIEKEDEIIESLVSPVEMNDEDDAWRKTVTDAVRKSLAAEGYQSKVSDSNGIFHDSNLQIEHLPANTNLNFNTLPKRSDVFPDHRDDIWPPLPENIPVELVSEMGDIRIQEFRQWLRFILFSMMSALETVSHSTNNRVDKVENDPSCGTNGYTLNSEAWAAAMSCLAMLSTQKGFVVRGFVEDVPLDALAKMYDVALNENWPEQVQCWLAKLLANLLYTSRVHQDSTFLSRAEQKDSTYGIRSIEELRKESVKHFRSDASHLQDSSTRVSSNPYGSIGMLANRVLNQTRIDKVGGPETVARWYMLAPTEVARGSFFCILYDFVTSCNHNMAIPTKGRAHWSEVEILGAFLLHSRVAEPLHILLRIGNLEDLDFKLIKSNELAAKYASYLPISMSDLINLLAVDIDIFQEMNSAAVNNATAAFLTTCLDHILGVVKLSCGIPSSLMPHFAATVVDVLDCNSKLPVIPTSNPRKLKDGKKNSDIESSSNDELNLNRLAWKAFTSLMYDKTNMSMEISETWMSQILVVVANNRISLLLESGLDPHSLLKMSTLSLLPDPTYFANKLHITEDRKNESTFESNENLLSPMQRLILGKTLVDMLSGNADAACLFGKHLAKAVRNIGNYLKIYCARNAVLSSEASSRDNHKIYLPVGLLLASKIAIDTTEKAFYWLNFLSSRLSEHQFSQSKQSLMSAYMTLSETILSAIMLRYVDPCAGHGRGFSSKDALQHETEPLTPNSYFKSAFFAQNDSPEPARVKAISETVSNSQVMEGKNDSARNMQEAHAAGSARSSTDTTSTVDSISIKSSSLSPRLKVLPPMPRFAAAWRRLTSPHSSRNSRESAKMKGNAISRKSMELDNTLRSDLTIASTKTKEEPSDAKPQHISHSSENISTRHPRPLSAGAKQSMMESAHSPARFPGYELDDRYMHQDATDSLENSNQHENSSSQLSNETKRLTPRRQYVSAPHVLEHGGTGSIVGTGVSKEYSLSGNENYERNEISSGARVSFLNQNLQAGSLKELAMKRQASKKDKVAELQHENNVVLALNEKNLGNLQCLLLLSGYGSVPLQLLEMLSPNLLRLLFDSINPDFIRGITSVKQLAHMDGAYPRSQIKIDIELNHYNESIMSHCGVWDMRLAILGFLFARIRMIGSVNQEGKDKANKTNGQNIVEAIDSEFMGNVLRDEDLRIRRMASLYSLAVLSKKYPQDYCKAVRQVISKSQRTDEKKALNYPEVQVSMMLDMKCVNLNMLL